MYTAKDADRAKIKKSAIIMIHGWIMLKKIDDGKYRIKNLRDGTYQFYRPRGKKPLARFYYSSVDPWIRQKPTEDLNHIEILRDESAEINSI